MHSSLNEVSKNKPSRKVAKARKTKKLPLKVIPEANYLSRIYATITGNSHRKFNQAQMTCFSRLAIHLKEHNITDCVTFFSAQLLNLEKQFFITTLLGDAAINRYFLLLERSRVYQDSGFHNEEEMLQTLCHIRNETPSIVIDTLEHSGIFSSQFVSYFRARSLGAELSRV